MVHLMEVPIAAGLGQWGADGRATPRR